MNHLIITGMQGWVKITLNRPAVKNALNTALLALKVKVTVPTAVAEKAAGL